jgi:general secretion pathway protein D
MLYSPEFSLPSERNKPNGLEVNAPLFPLYQSSSSSKASSRMPTLPSGYALSFVLILSALAALAPVRAHAQSASAWDKRGQTAELREDFDTAYEDYRKAHLKNPKDMRYTTHYDRMRFQAAVTHVERGRVLRQSGDTAGALAQLSRALQIDPSNDSARQEIEILQRLAPPTGGAAGGAGPGSPISSRSGISDQAAVLRSIGEVSAPLELHPMSDELITYHAVEDVKNIYQAVCKIAGLNVLFDPEYTSKRIQVDLTSVTVADALRLVGTIAGTYFKAVTPNTIYVFQNTHNKRQDLDELAVQTFYLTNPSQANDANEIQVAIRNLLDPSVKIYLVPSQNALVMRATTDQLLLAQKLINDLDRPKSEVVVDVAILEVNRDKIRTLGITLPQSFGLTPQASSTTANSTTSTTTTGTTTTPSNFTLNSLGNLNATNFAVNLTGGTLNALLTDSDTRVLQNPSVRATDGQHAVLKVGSKIPVATGSYSAGVTTTTASLGVQTQFQYLDVGVNIDMTPTVHLDGEVSLKIKVEDLSQTTSVTISGVTEPVIGQRSVEQTIQLRDGEPALLAGIIEKQDNNSLSGTPGLAELPILKYIFGSTSKEVSTDEVIFIIVPHIVREGVLTNANTRAIATGTNQSIELRRDPSLSDVQPVALNMAPAHTGPSISAANAASAGMQQLRENAAPPTPPGTAAANGAAPPPPPPPVNFTIQPPTSNQPVGSTFQMAVSVSHATDLNGVKIQAQFDPKILTLVNVDAGALLDVDGAHAQMVHRDEGNGLVTISAARPPGVAGVAGNGTFCTLTFRTLAPGDSKVTLLQVGTTDSKQASLPSVSAQGIVHVK